MPLTAQLKRMQDAAIVLVREVAQQEVIPRFLRARHALKDDGSLFSEADLAAQHYLAERLPAICNSPIIGEEMSREAQMEGWARAPPISSAASPGSRSRFPGGARAVPASR